MTLKEYLKRENMTVLDFSKQIRVGKPAILKWISGEARPTWFNMCCVISATKAAVTDKDFPPKRTKGKSNEQIN